ncbi:MAG: NAD(P)/FAD-dependent oxidoreductase [Chlamydiota bacterium]
MAYARVVIIGGGFAGLAAAKRLGGSKLDVWVIDKTNHHLFQPLLYQVATAGLSPADIAAPIREVLRKHQNITVVMGEVINIDKKAQVIHLKNGDDLAFDYLIIAPGTRHSYFNQPDWEKYAPGLKTLKDALTIRERILISFEKAERCDSISEARKYLNFVVVGGGPTGVEMAGAIAEIAYETMIKNFRRINVKNTKIYLIEGAKHVLPFYPEHLSKTAEKYLGKFGVVLLTSKKVTNVTNDGIYIENRFIETKNIIWAAGNQASPLLKSLDIPLDRAGRAFVDQDLSIPDHPNIFVLGDAATLKDKKGNPLPALAPVALQQGRYVAKIVKKKIKKEDRRPFKYFDKGSMATIGKSKAIGLFKGIPFKGLLAWLAWSFIHVVYLIGFRNRLSVLAQWIFAYYSSQRGGRLITKSLDDELMPDPEKDAL